MKKVILILFVIMLALGFSAAAGVNIYMKYSVENDIISVEDAYRIHDIDCIMVLGCRVKSDGEPSIMLSDRIEKGIELYEKKIAPKIIMSGDHGQKEYDEVNTMKSAAVDAGVPSSDIFMDHAGFSTYDSIYRAKDVFEADKIIIVSQEYHLYRALYIAKELGIEAYGISSDYDLYGGKQMIREVIARCKDFLKVKYRPEPVYLGEVIPVSGDGDLTND